MQDDEIPPVVLVVEDDAVLRGIYEIALRDAGFSPRFACDGLQAIAFLKEHTPDAVLLDMAMPGASGLAVIDVIRDRPAIARLPIIAVSGVSPTDDIWTGVQPRWDVYVQKPANFDEIMQMLRELIAKRRSAPVSTPGES